MKPNHSIPPYSSSKIVPAIWIGKPMTLLRRATILTNVGIKPD